MSRIPPFSTPAGLLARAVAIVALFLACHAAGLRDYTSVISFTPPEGATLDAWTVGLGFLYVAAWFGATFAAPVFAIAAGLMRLTSAFGAPPRRGTSARRS